MKLNKTQVSQFGSRNKKLLKIGYSSYGEYLKSDTWKQVKEYLLTIPEYHSCMACGCSKNLHFHHRSYKGLNKSIKRQKDWVVRLCDSCHLAVHELGTTSQCSLKGATKRIIKSRQLPQSLIA